jgi:hypothetical protein
MHADAAVRGRAHAGAASSRTRARKAYAGVHITHTIGLFPRFSILIWPFSFAAPFAIAIAAMDPERAIAN